jgi:cellulose synthase/poly-beta-1,6-N-acetylglucosamine synthase-like glycosyltransferase
MSAEECEMEVSSAKPTPIFSVIIPCWNAAATLRETFDSLLAQDFADWEAIVIDDGSTDETASIIAEFCERDARFSAFKGDRKGPSAARNIAGLVQSKAHLLAFLDSDDLWTPKKLSLTQLAFQQNEKLDGVYGQISFFRKSPTSPETYSAVYDRPLRPIDFLRDNPVCTMSNLVLKRSVFQRVGGFDESIVHNEDVELLVRITAQRGVIDGIKDHVVCYRTSLTGLSSNLNLMRAGWHKAVSTLQASPMWLTEDELAAADAGNLRYLARRALRTGAPGFEALRLAVQGIKRSPRSFLNPVWRGGFTLVGACTAPFLPKFIRKVAFSR